MATLQTLMAKLGLGQGSIFRLIKGDFGRGNRDGGTSGPGRALLALVAAAILLLPSLLLWQLAERFGKGGTLTMTAVRDDCDNTTFTTRV
ncbi:MAG: hypothetical protein ACYDET_04045 [Thermoleophilia bacterium]